MYGICQAPTQTFRYLSGLDQHHFDPDTTSRFDADPNPDPTDGFTNIGKSEKMLRLSSQQCQSALFYISRQPHSCHPFQYFGQ
jgi:hypothetical protein